MISNVRVTGRKCGCQAFQRNIPNISPSRASQDNQTRIANRASQPECPIFNRFPRNDHCSLSDRKSERSLSYRCATSRSVEGNGLVSSTQQGMAKLVTNRDLTVL